MELLRQFLHPQWQTIGIQANRWGARAREEVGIAPHGTIFVSSPLFSQREDGRFIDTSEKHILSPVAQNYIPRNIRRSARRDPATGTWKHGELTIGWRQLFDDLTKQGVLVACEEMTWLIGRDSLKMQDRRYHLPGASAGLMW